MLKTPDNLIIKYFEGKITQSEAKEVMEWLDQSIQNKEYFAALKKTYIELKFDAVQDDSEAEIAFEKFNKRISQIETNEWVDELGSIFVFSKQLLRYAAIILMILTIGGGSFFLGKLTNKSTTNNFCEISAPMGGKSSVVLPDGTKIWLNAGSKIKYNGDFNSGKRDIFLEGEAYFDVAKKKIPFIVHTSDIDIRVFGTSFNVKSYPDEDRIETTLVEGSIRVDRKESKPVFLSPKEKLIFYKKNADFETKKYSVDTNKTSKDTNYQKSVNETIVNDAIEVNTNVNIEEDVSWKDGSLIFNQENLESLTKKLERKYDITFSFENEDLKNYSFSGTLRDFPLEQVLRAIRFTSPINYTINEKTVVLSYNKKFNY
jgi:transmembrane sensor